VGYAYPILLDLTGGLAVIVGGGPVAARKARGALAAGAVVRAVAPDFCDEMPGEVQRVLEAYRIDHLAGARLVFAATDDPAVNNAVVRDAKSADIWVNRVDGEETDGAEVGNFVVPALFKHSGVIVSVAAGSAAVSVAIRDRLAERFEPAWSTMAAIAKTLRPLVRASGLAPSRRAAILREMTDFIEKLAKESNDAVKGEEAVRDWLQRRLAEERDGRE
jgi:siroheme synthase-like protein